MRKIIVFLVLLGICFSPKAQFPPAAGLPGSTAMYKDSSAFVAWATGCTFVRGPLQIDDLSQGFASVGTDSSVLGKAGENGILSLGDGGSVTLSFAKPIADGPGFDFAVFENAFSDTYLEFAFCEVSSNGVNFVRFPSTSHIPFANQVGPFDTVETSMVNNLAGKYRALYGTPFDLWDLAFSSIVQLNHITHVRLIDVVGNISAPYATYDFQGNAINDPWPTPFPSCGFDLDAVGVIWEEGSFGVENVENSALFSVYPNPISDESIIRFEKPVSGKITVILTDLSGKKISNSVHYMNSQLNVMPFSEFSSMNSGMYFLQIQSSNFKQTIKILKP